MPSLPVLVLNSGSSSIKFSVYEASGKERLRLFEGAVDGIGTDLGKFWIKDADGKKLVDSTPALPNRSVAFKLVADALNSDQFPAPKAIGHRMVCGGPTVQENQLITPDLIDEMEKYTAFAPLHTPIAIYIMREALKLFPGTPNFAILDTYFHRTMPEVVRHMPIPEEYSEMGVRRYGYHGISYESIIYQLQPNVPAKLIVAHLGNGASITAIRDGHCLDTSMGLTPTGGIGENDIDSRAEICAALGAIGIVLDAKRNNVRGAATISAENSPVTVRVIPPAEDLIIVNHVVRLLQA